MSRRTGERALLALALVVPALARAAEARIEARPDRTELAEDEVLTLEVRIESPDSPSSLEIPEQALPFRIVSRAEAQQSSISMGGGGGVRISTVHVTSLGLAPTRTGTLTIPPIVATVAGQRLATEPIQVKVLARGSRPAPGMPPEPQGGGSWRGWERDLVLQADVDKREAWIGEQVTVSVWLLSPVKLARYDEYRRPAYDGFWAEPMETPNTVQHQIRVVNGVPTRAYLVQRVALFPTRTGALTIGPYELEASVEIGGGSLFDPIPELRRVKRRSAPATIQVKPLPPGAPPGFDPVNVGRVALSAEVSDRTVTAGQAVTVRFAATGEGNVRAWALPRLPPIAGARVFDATPGDKVEPKGVRLAGTRTLETVLVPERTGELRIPAAEWSWFDPSTGKYQRTRTPELLVVVVPSGAVGAPAPGANAIAAGLRPIRSAAALSRAGPPPWRSRWFAAALALPVLGALALAAWERLRAFRGATSGMRRRRGAGSAARTRLARARRLMRAGDREALAEVERALVGYASDKLGRPAAGLTRPGLAAALQEAGAHPPAVRALAAALDACDAARFGRNGAAREEVLAAAERALETLDEAHWHREARP